MLHSGDCFSLKYKAKIPLLSSGNNAIILLLCSKTECLRLGLLLILLNVKHSHGSFLVEETIDGYCKHTYNHFLSMGNLFLLQKADPSTCLFISGNADFELLPPTLKWTVFP